MTDRAQEQINLEELARREVHPDDWVWITPEERAALIDAVEAAMPIGDYAASKQHPYVYVRCEEVDALAAALARFSVSGRETP